MRSASLGFAAALCLGFGAPACAAPPPLPAEHLTVERLPPRSPHWVYVFDEAFDNEIDARVHLFDGDSYRRLGQIDAGFTPSVNLSPDGATTVVATSYFARGSRGTRTDVVEFTDNTTLANTGEIVLPPKRVETAPSLFNVAYSADGHFLYVAYLTPAASFGVLDPAHGKVLGEIDTAGCVLVIPSGPNRVSSAERGKWRPGGQQVGAVHRGLGRLDVPMRQGGEGTHKDGGTEIWLFDLASHKRLARWPVRAAGLDPVIAVQVSQDAAPILFAATTRADVAVFDALSGRLRHLEKRLGQTPWLMLNP